VQRSNYLPGSRLSAHANQFDGDQQTGKLGGLKLAPHATTNFTVTAYSAELAHTPTWPWRPRMHLTEPTNNNGTATNSQVRHRDLALADVQVFKDGGTNVAAGGIVNYTITTTNSGPSTQPMLW